MSPEEIVRAELGAWDRLDADEIVSHFADDAVWGFPGGLFTGHNEMREAVNGYLARTSRCQLEVCGCGIPGTSTPNIPSTLVALPTLRRPNSQRGPNDPPTRRRRRRLPRRRSPGRPVARPARTPG